MLVSVSIVYMNESLQCCRWQIGRRSNVLISELSHRLMNLHRPGSNAESGRKSPAARMYIRRFVLVSFRCKSRRNKRKISILERDGFYGHHATVRYTATYAFKYSSPRQLRGVHVFAHLKFTSLEHTRTHALEQTRQQHAQRLKSDEISDSSEAPSNCFT